MWFPYSLPSRWSVEQGGENAADALADATRRDFVVGFYLRNPVTGKWETEILLTETHWEVIEGGDSEHRWTVAFAPNARGRLSEVIYQGTAKGPERMVRACSGHLAHLLDFWSLTYGRGLAVAGFRVADIRLGVRWLVCPHRPSTLHFALPAYRDVPPQGHGLAAAYREVRNASGAASRLAAALALIEQWRRGSGAFAGLRRQGRGGHAPSRSSAQTVTREHVVLAGLHESEEQFEGVPFQDLVERLEPWRVEGQNHLLGRAGPNEAQDNGRAAELASVANLADLVLREILLEELKPWETSEPRAEGVEDTGRPATGTSSAP